MWFFEKAIDMAIEVAKDTVKIESDDEAYQMIVEKINGQDGVKAKVVKMVEDYLYRVPGMSSRNSRLASAKIENFDLIGDSFMNHLTKIVNNIDKVKVQKSLF
ncbi:MAG: hypothetical protein C0601_05615 [Candidatus Muiribacterium halophilum]|uniref:Uncharacterized protein n=1 Tax=Muiribacterium halophilum TaxID=2053465 RepID=A0A2N5ZHE7_MUIH1|nr:MAG: hypothetical protein C0601_05615 [Candidatus Muirbacterium halophilum]